ncbi:MAG: hydratase, partial [Clostridia bacterium]|nr:hydratase [Clostridia bacterium]
MLKLYDSGVYLLNGRDLVTDANEAALKAGHPVSQAEAAQGTIAYGVLKAHNKSGDMDHLQMRFDSLTSHDITYVGIIQTARASGMKEFPMPYVLTNCHNSLC